MITTTKMGGDKSRDQRVTSAVKNNSAANNENDQDAIMEDPHFYNKPRNKSRTTKPGRAVGIS